MQSSDVILSAKQSKDSLQSGLLLHSKEHLVSYPVKLKRCHPESETVEGLAFRSGFYLVLEIKEK